MKSKWKVSSQYWGEEHVFQVYRTIDIGETDHSGNREYATNKVFHEKAAAQECANNMNQQDND